MKKIWIVAISFYGLLNSILIAKESSGTLLNGYSFLKTTAIDSYDEPIVKIEIFKDKKLVARKKNSYVFLGDEIVSENYLTFDVNGDGVKEILFSSRSGGNHCCYDTELLSLGEGELKTLLKVNLENYSALKLEDLNNDKIDEVLIYDDAYSYVGNFSFADSPLVDIILELKNGKYIFSEKLMKIKKVDKGNRYRSGIQVFLDYLYRGDYKKGILSIKKESMPIEDDMFTVEGWFINNFEATIERATKSIYWKHIKNMNGWANYSDKEIKKILIDEAQKAFLDYNKWI